MVDTNKDGRPVPPGDPPEDTPAARLSRVLERLDALDRKLDAIRTEKDPDALLTEQEAADLLGVTPRTMQTMRKAGEITALRVRSAVRYTRPAVQGYIRRQAKAGAREGRI